MASIFDLFNNSNAQDAANSQISALQSANQQGQGYLANGLTNAQNSYSAGLQPLQQNYDQSTQGANAYGNALGLNGAAGSASAVQNWQNSNPAYQAQLDAASQNVMRNQAATGQLASGGTNIDLQNLAENQANSTYQQYLTNLQPYLGQQATAANGIANVNTAQAGTQSNTAANQANMAYGAQVGQGNAQANADLANNAAAANQFGALKSGLSLGSTLLGFL